MLVGEAKLLLGRGLMAIFVIGLLVSSIVYLNSRWAKIRDIRRQADAQQIVKALDFYNGEVGAYPANTQNDGDGWDKTNDTGRIFLQPLSQLGLISSLIFDPKNDLTHYYRYQKFASGKFGCSRPFAVFQIANFETQNKMIGNGQCPSMDWAAAVPNGYTWFAFD